MSGAPFFVSLLSSPWALSILVISVWLLSSLTVSVGIQISSFDSLTGLVALTGRPANRVPVSDLFSITRSIGSDEFARWESSSGAFSFLVDLNRISLY